MVILHNLSFAIQNAIENESSEVSVRSSVGELEMRMIARFKFSVVVNNSNLIKKKK